MEWQEVSTARRRLAQEQGAIVKDWGGRLPVALIYPNSYAAGMSGLGFQTVYGQLNALPYVVCERAFAEPVPGGRQPITSETQRPLSDFAVLAFSVTYELDYWHVVSVLRQAGMPAPGGGARPAAPPGHRRRPGAHRQPRAGRRPSSTPSSSASPSPCLPRSWRRSGTAHPRGQGRLCWMPWRPARASTCPPWGPGAAVTRQYAPDLEAFATTLGGADAPDRVRRHVPGGGGAGLRPRLPLLHGAEHHRAGARAVGGRSLLAQARAGPDLSPQDRPGGSGHLGLRRA